MDDKSFNLVGTGYSATLSAWQTATSQEANSLDSDPLFTDSANDDFTLTSLSPAINAGIDVGLTRDYAGTTLSDLTIPYGFDIGAYFYDRPLSTTEPNNKLSPWQVTPFKQTPKEIVPWKVQ